MASPPVKAAAPRASSILSQETSARNPTKPQPSGAPLNITTKAWVTLRRVFFTVADFEAPDKIYDVVNRVQEATLQVLGVISTNQLLPGNILRSVTFTAGQTQMLAHGLGREWQGFFHCRVYPGAGDPILKEIAYASGVGADSVLPLISTNAGTYDIYVF